MITTRHLLAGNNTVGSLDYFLELQMVDTLKYLAAFLPAKRKPSRKAELIKLVKSCMLGEQLEILWARLDDMQKLAIGETLHTYGGEFTPSRFEAKYGVLPILTDNSKSRHQYDIRPSLLGLFMYSEHRYGGGTLTIPTDLRDKLQAFVPPPTLTSLKSIETLPDTETEFKLSRRDTEASSLQDLITVLKLTSQGKISVSNKTLLPSKSSIKTITAALRDGDFYTDEDTDCFGDTIEPIKGFAWPLLIQAAKLTELKGSKLSLKNAGIKAMSAAPADTIKGIWKSWLSTGLIDEFNRINAIKGQKRKSRKTLTDAVERRVEISDALAQCPLGEWIRLDEFSNFMQSEDYFFNVTETPWDLYICDPEYGSLGYSGYHDWHILQGRYIACLLLEYAATLGLIDVAYIHPQDAEPDYRELWGTDDLPYLSRYDGLVYFRLTDLGAYCLGVTDRYEQKALVSSVKLSVLPNLHIQTTDELPFNQAQLLEIYTDKISRHQWRFNPDKMLEAVENGHDIRGLEKFLSEADDQLLPESVESLINRVERQAKSLHIKGSTLLIECIDAETAKKVAQHEHTKKHCMLAGEKHLVLTGTEKAFRKALRKLGFGMPPV